MSVFCKSMVAVFGNNFGVFPRRFSAKWNNNDYRQLFRAIKRTSVGIRALEEAKCTETKRGSSAATTPCSPWIRALKEIVWKAQILCSPDLVPSDLCLLGPLKETIRCYHNILNMSSRFVVISFWQLQYTCMAQNFTHPITASTEIQFMKQRKTLFIPWKKLILLKLNPYEFLRKCNTSDTYKPTCLRL